MLWLCGDSSRNITFRLSLSAASSDESLAMLVVGTAETAKNCAFYSRNNAGRFEEARRCLSLSRASVLKSFKSICKKKEIVLSGRNKLSDCDFCSSPVLGGMPGQQQAYDSWMPFRAKGLQDAAMRSLPFPAGRGTVGWPTKVSADSSCGAFTSCSKLTHPHTPTPRLFRRRECSHVRQIRRARRALTVDLAQRVQICENLLFDGIC